MRAPYLDDGDVRLYLGDCVEVMAEMAPESVDAVVCDPPYGLRFMGQAWDGADIVALAKSQAAGTYDMKQNGAFQAWCETWAREALRVLKPGGHLLAFGGTRTFHRLTCAIEDAGFEVRDCLSYLYGCGFPKSLDVSKAIDKAAGARGEYGAPKSAAHAGWIDRGRMRGDDGHDGYQRPWMQDGEAVDRNARQYLPATDDARRWQGWGTALKPAWEPCVVARKPLVGTVAANVMAHGTGAINVEGCRIPHASDADRDESEAKNQHTRYANPGSNRDGYSGNMPARTDYNGGAWRWPANVLLDEEAAAMLDEQSGERPSGARRAGDYGGIESGAIYRGGGVTALPAIDASTGGASRFFYTAKASTAERDGTKHPTVKPLDLMRWLVRLVTPPGGLVLDPFAGSGTTLLAARREGLRAVGIEREPDYAKDAAHRLRELSLFGGAA